MYILFQGVLIKNVIDLNRISTNWENLRMQTSVSGNAQSAVLCRLLDRNPSLSHCLHWPLRRRIVSARSTTLSHSKQIHIKWKNLQLSRVAPVLVWPPSICRSCAIPSKRCTTHGRAGIGASVTVHDGTATGTIVIPRPWWSQWRMTCQRNRIATMARLKNITQRHRVT